jgi:hypothetical protein
MITKSRNYNARCFTSLQNCKGIKYLALLPSMDFKFSIFDSIRLWAPKMRRDMPTCAAYSGSCCAAHDLPQATWLGRKRVSESIKRLAVL